MASTTALPRFSPMIAAAPAADGPRKRGGVAIGARAAVKLWRRKKAVFVDLRDWEVMDQTGWIEGSMHCPPGDFANLVSPSSPLHARLFEPGAVFIFYGGPKWEPLASAKRARELGLEGALALRGGLRAWREAGGRVTGHPNSPFPALKASITLATRHAKRRFGQWWRGAPKRRALKKA